MTATQRAVVDDFGNINVHGRSALQVVWKVKDAEGTFLNISASDLFIEIAGSIRVALTAGEDDYSRKLSLTRAQIAALPLNQPLSYALHDETPSSAATIWSGKITAYGFRAAPPGADAVEPGAASWTGATVTVMQGESVPTVVVTYMGATGAAGTGIPTGGTVGQYIRKASATNFDTAWDTITADDVSGLSASLSTLTSADVSLTSRVSTEEAGRGSADTSLTSRLSTEETARGSADTSLATAAAATYLPLAGGTMTGLLTVSRSAVGSTGGITLTNQNTSGWGSALTFNGTLSGTIDTARILSQHPASGSGELQFQTALSSSLGTRMTIAPSGATTITVADATSGVPLTLSVPSGANYAQRILNRTYSTSLPVFSYYPQNDGVLLLGTDQATDLRIYTNGFSNPRLIITAAGNLLAAADNTYDIGASGASRPRIVYIGTRVVSPTVTTTATTVASLPAAATAGAGGRAFVTDATATTYLSVVAGGGANAVPVVSNGTNWLIG
jgi:hypothetical protein